MNLIKQAILEHLKEFVAKHKLKVSLSSEDEFCPIPSNGMYIIDIESGYYRLPGPGAFNKYKIIDLNNPDAISILENSLMNYEFPLW